MNAGVTALLDRQYDKAAGDFHHAATTRKDDPQPLLLEGEALVYGGRAREALHPLQRTLQLDPTSTQAHVLLAAVYAGSDLPKERDAEVALLKQWHSDGKHPILGREDGFLLETFHTGGWHVNVQSYFEPQGDPPVYWRFTVRDRAEVPERSYCMQAMPAPQKGFALIRCAEPDMPAPSANESPVKLYAEMPDYSEVRKDLAGSLRLIAPGKKISGAAR